jgi:exodeoxyribonuclease VII large subunit
MDDRLGLPFDDTPAVSERPLSVSELTGRIRSLLEGAFTRLQVEGELSNCRRWSSGHLYFTLKDEQSQLRAVMFRSRARTLTFGPEDGMRVVAGGRLGVYAVKGDYQLVCETLQPHGLGALQAAFDQLKRKLQAEGLFDAGDKRPLPMLPRRIGVVTSRDGAALHDILQILTTRHPSARIVIRPARVQGDEAPRALVRALQAIARVPEIDVVIIGRGGGSTEDLSAFNDEALARAIRACPVPVISAVGHEIDFTIADFVADVRASTPSNAAELVVERTDHVHRRIDVSTERLRRTVRDMVGRGHDRLTRLRLGLERWPLSIALRDRDREQARWRLRQALAAHVGCVRARFDALERRLERRDVRQLTADLRTRLVRADGRIGAAMPARLAAADARTRELAGRLDSLSPLSVLGRGYAVCWNDERTSIIRSADAVRPGDGVRVTLAEGELACRVNTAWLHDERPRGSEPKT